MEKDRPDREPDQRALNPKEFAFASKEGLIIVSLILFAMYAFWYIIFEHYYHDKFITWDIIFMAFSLIVFITMLILLITGIYVLITDRIYIFVHEKFGAGIFLIGALVLLVVPFGWTAGIVEYQPGGPLSSSAVIFTAVGTALCIIGALILARTGGFFIVWLIGIIIYLIISFHEGFKFLIWTMHFGPYDSYVGTIAAGVVITSFILFLYHDLKFFYLSRIIKKGNRLRKQKKYDAALKCFNKALKIYPLFTTAWNNMGNVYFNMGRPGEALKCYQKALTFNPDYLNAKKNIAVVTKKIKI